jgi:AraC family transcriptional regulator, transcriptional activator of pobA
MSELEPRVIFFEVSGAENELNYSIERYHTHLVCHAGKVRFVFNNQEMECKAGEFLFWFAQSRLTNLSFSKNFKATVLLVEKEFLNENIPNQGWSINALLHSRVYPVKQMEKKDKSKILSNFKWLYDRSMDNSHRFFEEALHLQMQIFILEMWNIFANEYERRKHTLQTGTLYERFMQLAQEHCMEEREVQYYSDRLNITPKYLNQISKVNSGVTASQWIHRYAKERIIILLQNKLLNISEIAEEMKFSSRSFFTRYVKKLLGMTPKEYRQRLD